MSYTRRHRYKSMREKNASFWKKIKTSFIILIIAATVYIYKNRVSIKDYLWTYFN